MESPPKRIVTRPDFDGIVCAVLLRDAEDIVSDVYWVEPNEIQTGKADIRPGDIIANLPFSSECTLWFDHHISNKPKNEFRGAFDVAPSAARVIYRYYQEKGIMDDRYDELLFHTDVIDAAQLSLDQVRFPEKYPYILLSMTIKNNDYADIDYWNLLVDLLKDTSAEQLMDHPRVHPRCREVIKENAEWESHLKAHTRIEHGISITDFRSLETVPAGNRFLSYSMFPESIASVKIRFDSPACRNVQVSVGRSIFNRKCNVNIGKLLSGFGGGGHAGAGGCTLPAESAEENLRKILKVMVDNQPVD
ncbi:MAG: exopolyphosphatase [Desulfobacterales bacterium]|nr:exopolyphosphatase [Desulfobacterales bacterium]